MESRDPTRFARIAGVADVAGNVIRSVKQSACDGCGCASGTFWTRRSGRARHVRA